MASQTEIRSLRIAKKEVLEKEGMDSYPISSKVTNTIKETIADFSKLSKKKGGVILAGRIMSLRPQGKLAFLNIFDGTGLFQVLLKKDEIEEKSFDLFVDTIDIGDIVQFKGELFVTKRKEKTILAKEWTMLSKSLRPLPEKWHGLKDVEERYRRRYLDSLMSEEVRERFYLRSKIITEIRSFLDKNDFLEVETPSLQPFAGGASAKPFITHHNALDTDLYLRIAVELYLKRMIIGGFPKVYEIGRNFRNEGIDATHNPEFTMIEWYQSFSDAKEQMVFVEKLFKLLVKNIYKKKSLKFGEQEIDFSKKFAIVSYFDLLKRYALIVNPETMEKKELVLKARQLGVDVKQSDSIEKIFDSIYKKTCRPKIIQPTFIVDYPVHYLPLAKRKKENKNLVDAFQLVVGGIELVKGFSELNDPLDQRERFLEQEKDRDMGDDEAQGLDEEFIEALEYGMPPTGGVGVGIDRLVMLFTDVSNIREVIYFPTLRPKE